MKPVSLSYATARVLPALKGKPVGLRVIEERVGIPRRTLCRWLAMLVSEGLVVRDGHHRYAIVGDPKSNTLATLTALRFRGETVGERAKLEALQAYSTGRVICVCCAESRLEFLTLDHPDGDGKAHRERAVREAGKGYKFYEWLRGLGYPKSPRLRVLCANCNMATRGNKTCPHRLESTEPVNARAVADA